MREPCDDFFDIERPAETGNSSGRMLTIVIDSDILQIGEIEGFVVEEAILVTH